MASDEAHPDKLNRRTVSRIHEAVNIAPKAKAMIFLQVTQSIIALDLAVLLVVFSIDSNLKRMDSSPRKIALYSVRSI
jgi:hypothetical protein